MATAEKPQLTFVERALLVDRLLVGDLEYFLEPDRESSEEIERVVTQRAGAINSLGIFPQERVVDIKYDQATQINTPEESRLLLLRINGERSRRTGPHRLDGGYVLSTIGYFVTSDGIIQEYQVGEKDGERIVRLLPGSAPLVSDKAIKLAKLALASMRSVIKQSLVSARI